MSVMATGYVLINAKPGMEFQAFQAIKEMDHVVAVSYTHLRAHAT